MALSRVNMRQPVCIVRDDAPRSARHPGHNCVSDSGTRAGAFGRGHVTCDALFARGMPQSNWRPLAILGAMEQTSTTTRVYLSAAAPVIGGFVVGISVVGSGIISSYGGIFDSVRCIDPNIPACTGLYYYHGMPGIIPIAAGILGLAIIVTGALALRRSFQRPGHGHSTGMRLSDGKGTVRE